MYIHQTYEIRLLSYLVSLHVLSTLFSSSCRTPRSHSPVALRPVEVVAPCSLVSKDLHCSGCSSSHCHSGSSNNQCPFRRSSSSRRSYRFERSLKTPLAAECYCIECSLDCRHPRSNRRKSLTPDCRVLRRGSCCSLHECDGVYHKVSQTLTKMFYSRITYCARLSERENVLSQ